jgi:hypothetical protein
MTYYRVYNESNTKGGTCGAPEFATVFLICISEVRVVTQVKVHVLTCFIPCCHLRYEFPIKRCSIRPDLRVVLCVVNDIRLSSHILVSSKIFILDDVRVVKKKHDGYLM